MRGGPPDVNDGKREESRGPDELRRRSSRTDLDEVALIRQPDAGRVFAIDGTAAEQPRIVCMGVHMMSNRVTFRPPLRRASRHTEPRAVERSPGSL
jgi:hypothetical protein